MQIKKIEYNEKERVETGPIQFGNDWPGIFIRGDNCGYYVQCLVELKKYPDSSMAQSALDDIISLLKKCQVY